MKNKKLLTILGVTTLLVGGMFVNQKAESVNAYTNKSSKIYFVKPSGWTASTVVFMIGHDSYSRGYTMSQVGSSSLYYVSVGDDWGDSKYYAFFNTQGDWGGENNSISKRQQYADNYTGQKSSYDLNKNNYYYCTAASGSKGAALTIDWKGASATTLNVKLTTNATTGGSATVSGNKLTADTTLSSSSGASADIALSTSATLTATADVNYKFAGWYNAATGGTLLSSNASYTVSNVSAATTYYARFESALPGEVEALVSKYYSEGTYTRDTTINFNEEAVNEISTYFHAKATQLVRTTYFTPNALWMSRGNGEYSYYGSEGGNLTNGTAKEANVVPTYHTAVKNTSMEDYYTTLKDIKEAVGAAAWTKDGTVYTSTDATLIKYFLDFTAPCFLNHDDTNANYLGLEKVTVEESGESLLLKLHVKSGDSGKLVGENNTVLSVATITK